MGIFFLRFFLLTLFVTLFLLREFKHRRERKLEPQNLKQLFSLGAKWKKDSNPPITALLFASSAFLGFVIWESLFLSVFNVFPLLNWTLPFGIVAAVLLLRKRDNFHPWTFKEVLAAEACVGIVGGALFCWVLFVWVYFRARFLKKS